MPVCVCMCVCVCVCVCVQYCTVSLCSTATVKSGQDQTMSVFLIVLGCSCNCVLCIHSSTFYVIDPKRLQTATDMTDDSYDFAEICKKLKPNDSTISQGKYQIVVVTPKVFFFEFAKGDTIAASKAGSRNFVLLSSSVDFDTMLPPPVAPCDHTLVQFDLAIVVKSNLGAGYQALKDGVSSLQECTHEQVDKLVQEFRQTMDESILPVSPLNELVINRSLEVQLQKSLFPEFVVACQQTTLADFPVSRSSTSREDLVIFHKDKFMCDASRP